MEKVMSMVWPTLGSRMAKEQNIYCILVLCIHSIHSGELVENLRISSPIMCSNSFVNSSTR